MSEPPPRHLHRPHVVPPPRHFRRSALFDIFFPLHLGREVKGLDPDANVYFSTSQETPLVWFATFIST